MTPPNGISTEAVVRESNVSPVAQVQTNSSGNITLTFPANFTLTVTGWSNYFAALGRMGKTSLQIQITYLFQYNITRDQVVLFSDAIPFVPSYVLRNSELNISEHSSLNGQLLS
ncbi:MAG: hypothetical protein M0Z77_10615 [Thermoplasmatales archaeon]|nr:hypothetical protein [Thermoplasmatales archaeon]